MKQPGGYSAFIPKPLPPDPPIALDEKLQSLLSDADRALGRLDGSIQTLPDPDLFVFMYVRKEAVLSSQIEGTQSSLNDLLEAEAKIADPDRPKDVDEVLNYTAAMNYGLERLEELPVSVRLIREIQKKLLEGVRGTQRQPGELRRTQNWIGPAGATIQDASFVPPPAAELGDALGAWERFLQTDDTMPILVKIGLTHAQFETIHPFLDGNGRVGRLLITFLLCERRVLLKPVLYLSYYFRKNRDRYYELLQSTRDTGDWEAWLKFFLAGVSETSVEATDMARRIVALRERHRRLITDDFGRVAGNGLRVLEALYRRPFVTVKGIVELTGVSFTAANQLAHRFLQHHMLDEVTGQARNRRFKYSEYIALFAQ